LINALKTLVSKHERKNTFETLQRGGRIILKWIRVGSDSSGKELGRILGECKHGSKLPIPLKLEIYLPAEDCKLFHGTRSAYDMAGKFSNCLDRL